MLLRVLLHTTADANDVRQFVVTYNNTYKAKKTSGAWKHVENLLRLLYGAPAATKKSNSIEFNVSSGTVSASVLCG